MLQRGETTTYATLATLDVRFLESCPFASRELVASVRLVSLRAGRADLSIDEGARRLIEQLRVLPR